MLEKLLLQNLEKECEERIEKLNAAHAEKVAALEKQVQQAAETGANKARAESGAQIAQRDNTIAEWQRKYENQGDYYSKKLLECEGQVAAAREETALKVRENNSLRRKVAIEINFKSKNGRVLRSYLRRPGMKFEDAVKELCKDIQKLHGDVKFFKDGQETTRRARTLGEVCCGLLCATMSFECWLTVL